MRPTLDRRKRTSRLLPRKLTFFWGDYLPTIRSYFNFQQFQRVLQTQAHRLAVEAVKNLDQGDVRIQIDGDRFSVVETSRVTVRFYANHISYFEQPIPKSYKSWWGFDVEEKLFMTSNHSTKISFADGNPAETTAKKKKIEEFIDKIMGEAEIKPVPRFTLQSKKGTNM